MQPPRRRFLKTAGASASAALTAGALPAVTASTAAAAATPADEPDLPRGVTLGTIRRRGAWALAARTEQGVLDVGAAGEAAGVKVPESMHALFTHGGGANCPAGAQRAGQRAAAALPLAESDVEFGPCITDPEKIICVGLNYRKHAREIGAEPPSTPMLFNKYNNALMGHRGTLRLPTQVASAFDYEVELVIVIGRTAHNVTPAQALDHVAGYCTGNDMSARDLQNRTSQIMLGKTCDGFAPVGPWMVSADQVSDPNALDIWCEVNGERRQSSSTSDMIFDCRNLVSYISRHMTLKPGDIIFTGTPEGVIAGYKREKQVWLKPGDRVRCGIGALGDLEFVLA
ncbi:MAG: fumarylacetoacetate hydrolase family protein [Burkholderiales bacterium]|nr:fumarylacetoacetate hydrolase family protein [Burkholderiales bacterium]